METADLIIKILLRLALASVCGAVIGYERQKREKVAGVRTHFIVCMAACLTMLLSKYAFMDVLLYGKEQELMIRLDPSRIAAGTVTAIGFLGAGTIVITKRTVMGVTTAAGIWATVGVGLTVGSGFYLTGVIVTLFMIGFSIFLHHFFADRVPILFEFVGNMDHLQYESIKRMLEAKGLEVRSIRWERKDEKTKELFMQCLLPPHLKGDELIDWASTLPNFRQMEVGS